MLSYLKFILVAIFFTIISCDSHFVTAKEKCPIIKISTGEISGVEKESRNDRVFCAFRGIPYAKPPIGKLRFEPPEPTTSWTGVKKLDDYESSCVQFNSRKNEVIGNEDCLFLNVFTPLIEGGISTDLMPVMVFFHGGYFMVGSANNYRPHYFMDENVVIVTLNYRLGAFGFLNTEDGLIRGNMGLKDQALALQWVQKNIGAFGGDNSRVTIFGNSAGASSVHYHLLSPMSKGLFHKAISQSGTAIKIRSFQTNPKERAMHLAKVLNCDAFLNNTSTSSKWQEVNNTAMVDCLKNASASDIGKVYKEAMDSPRNILLSMAPSVEITHKLDNDTFMNEHPFAIMVAGRQQRIPWIVGQNSEEGLFVSVEIAHNSELMALVENHWDEYAPNFLQYDRHRTDITDKIRRFYFSNIDDTSARKSFELSEGAANITTNAIAASIIDTLVDEQDPIINFHDKFINFTNIFTDRLYGSSIYKTIAIQSKFSPVFAYYYNYKSEYTFANEFSKKPSGTEANLKKATNWFKKKVLGKVVQELEHLGVCHADENLLLFKYADAKVKSDSKDYKMSRDLVKLWVQFAYDGKSLKFGDIAWTPVKLKNIDEIVNGNSTKSQSQCPPVSYNVLRLSNLPTETGMIPVPDSDRIHFWESLDYLPVY